MKKVLLLGDSIRIGYQPFVKKLLAGRAEVSGPDDNCRFAHYTLWYLPAWLNNVGSVDVIHWNNGLWDGSMHLSNGEPFISISQYTEILSRIIVEIRKMRPDTPVVFALTTPVIPGPNTIDNETIDVFNSAALRVMKNEGIEVNDLNKLIGQDESLFAPDKLHLSEKGYTHAAQAVVHSIEKYL